ncbi:MAG: nucleotidyltransferase domain-containing protein [Acidobacteriaceae bacterium]|nr:nucleotidyltransferase domain-containing protein [Acidobacteriaceae bacterium]MBV9498983.1 nucleotidyltransferase domain-containing protein [Acidobacteriaceae bacterium]
MADSAAVQVAAADSAALGEVISAVVAQAATGRDSKQEHQMEQQLRELVERLRTAFGGKLVSAILYGSATMGDWDETTSDLNILCVLNQLTPAELGAAEPIIRWWRGRGNPSPLLLTEEEVKASTDCFPMEFRDMQEHRRVLYGSDVIRDLVVDRSFYRAQVEHELRAKQIRLRQHAASVLSSPERLTALLSESISTFCVLGRHALILNGDPPRWKKEEVVAALRTATGHAWSAASEILGIRAEKRKPANALLLLERYLREFDELIRFVDTMPVAAAERGSV